MRTWMRAGLLGAGALAIAVGTGLPASAGAGLAIGSGADAFFAPPLVRQVAYGPNQVAAMLHKRGYRNVRIADGRASGFSALACKGKSEYRLAINRNGRIVNVDRVGRCGRPPPPRDGVHVRAPHAGVDVDRRDGVRVRAPFVDLHIPR